MDRVDMSRVERSSDAASLKFGTSAGRALPRPGLAFDRVASRRVFLFLQGAASTFHFRLGKALRQRGATVVKVHLCGGDLVFWPGRAVLYRGSPGNWPAYVAALMRERGVTDLVLFGDCRPYHAPAVRLARQASLRLHLFEEGYLRPGWITRETRGVNDHSDLPRNPRLLLAAASSQGEPPEPVAARERFALRAGWDVLWHAGYALLAPLFTRYRRHTLVHPLLDYAGWVRHGLRTPLDRRRDRAALAHLSQTSQPYFLLPLQLDGDYQMRVHSDFASMAQAVDEVIASFARAAPGDALLVVKRHPFDMALHDSRKVVEQLAAAHGIGSRLVFVERGDIAPLVAGAAGVLVVNSTTAMLALERGVPLRVLGRATYDLPGLAHQGSLDTFWTGAAPPDAALWRAYRRVLIMRTQVPGGFFSPAGIRQAVEGCVARMLQPATMRRE